MSVVTKVRSKREEALRLLAEDLGLKEGRFSVEDGEDRPGTCPTARLMVEGRTAATASYNMLKDAVTVRTESACGKASATASLSKLRGRKPYQMMAAGLRSIVGAIVEEEEQGEEVCRQITLTLGKIEGVRRRSRAGFWTVHAKVDGHAVELVPLKKGRIGGKVGADSVLKTLTPAVISAFSAAAKLGASAHVGVQGYLSFHAVGTDAKQVCSLLTKVVAKMKGVLTQPLLKARRDHDIRLLDFGDEVLPKGWKADKR